MGSFPTLTLARCCGPAAPRRGDAPNCHESLHLVCSRPITVCAQTLSAKWTFIPNFYFYITIKITLWKYKVLRAAVPARCRVPLKTLRQTFLPLS